MGQPRAKTGANLRPNRANIGQQQQPPQPRAKSGANLRPNTTTTTTKTKDDNDNNNNHNNNNNLGPRQGQTCAQIGPTSVNNNNNTPRQGQTCAQIGPTSVNNNTTTTNNNNTSSGSRVCFCRRPAVRRKPHKSGQGPPGRVLAVRQFSPLRRREGPRPLPPTHSPPPRVAKNPRVLQCFVLVAFFSHFSDPVAQDGSTWANIGRKMGQHSLKMGQHSPQDGPT